MSDKPLLMFPDRAIVSRYKLFGGVGRDFKRPSQQTQVTRIEPKFETLETVFQNRRIEVQSIADGAEPEMVLVLETRGSIGDFFKAVKLIPELDWLGELEEEFEQDEAFYYEGNDKPIKGKLFFVMSNHEGLRQLQSLWNNYYKRGVQFERGLTKWRDLFNLLYDIRLWGTSDRIQETGILEDWQQRIESNQEIIPFEIELWYRDSEEQRTKSRTNIINLVSSLQGRIVQEAVIEGIAYHAMLAEAPTSIFEKLLERDDIALFKAEEIMFIRPVGQCIIPTGEISEEQPSVAAQRVLPILPPVIALLDGLPVQNHELLTGRIQVDDPDGYEENYPASFRKHGTGIASVIINGDLNAENAPLKTLLYIRPVMKYYPSFTGGVEKLPENELTVDLIHRAVKNIFENEDGTSKNESIKIINISLGDSSRVFDNYMSAWARLLDWLSVKYNILFIVSTGNYLDHVNLNASISEIRTLLLNQQDLTKESIKHIYQGLRNRKLLSPAESINSLTVGSSDSDLCTTFPNLNRLSLFNNPAMFSPISRFGHGYRRSIKPDLIMPGGRTLYNEPLGSPSLRMNNSGGPPGLKTAAPSANGALNNTIFTRGTSNSAALLSRSAGLIYESLVEDGLDEAVTVDYFPLIAKSLLVHGAKWEEVNQQIIVDSVNNHSLNQKDLVSRFFGYGQPVLSRVQECSSNRVTLLGYGELKAESAHEYKLPIPVALSGQIAWKRLIVTLAWFTPISPKNQIYRKSKLWADFPDKEHENILALSRKYYDHDTVNRGTIQHEVFESTRAAAFNSPAAIPIRINCKEDAYGFKEIVKYALAVTLEVDESLQVDLYNEVKAAIQPQVRV